LRHKCRENEDLIVNVDLNHALLLALGLLSCCFVHANILLFDLLLGDPESDDGLLLGVLLLYKLTMYNGLGSFHFLDGLLLVYVILDDILRDGREFNLLDQLVELLV